jgi:flagellar hook-length control protein FliK
MQPSKTVNTPFGQVGWTQAINQHIVVMVNEKSQSIRLTLNPPELGPVEVNVRVENKVASVQFVSAAPEVQKALQDGLPVLQEMLSQAGIDLGKTDIGNKQSSRSNKFFSVSRDASRAEKEDETASIIKNTSSTRLSRFGIINTYA